MAAMAGVDGDGDDDGTGQDGVGHRRTGYPLADAVQPMVFPPETQIIPATTYFPERLPSQYLRRWRA